MTVSDQANGIVRRDLVNQLREPEAVEFRSLPEDGDIDSRQRRRQRVGRIDRERALARPSEKDNVQRPLRSGLPEPLEGVGRVFAHCVAGHIAAMHDDADGDSGAQRTDELGLSDPLDAGRTILGEVIELAALDAAAAVRMAVSNADEPMRFMIDVAGTAMSRVGVPVGFCILSDSNRG